MSGCGWEVVHGWCTLFISLPAPPPACPHHCLPTICNLAYLPTRPPATACFCYCSRPSGPGGGLGSLTHLLLPTGPSVAGRELDQVVGAGTLQIAGDVAARLLRGERVTAPVGLGQTQHSVGHPSTTSDMLVGTG